MKKNPTIRPLNDETLGDLSIEELEERLELQVVHPPETQVCYDCDGHVDCETFVDEGDGGGDGGGGDEDPPFLCSIHAQSVE